MRDRSRKKYETAARRPRARLTWARLASFGPDADNGEATCGPRPEHDGGNRHDFTSAGSDQHRQRPVLLAIRRGCETLGDLPLHGPIMRSNGRSESRKFAMTGVADAVRQIGDEL